MAGELIKAGERMITIGNPVEKLMLITKGRIKVDCPGGSYEIGVGDIAGICEVALEIHILNYTAIEETEVYPYPIVSAESIRGALGANANVARLFIRSMIRQISSMMNACQLEQVHCNEVYRSLKTDYKDYIMDLAKTSLPIETISGIEEMDVYIGEEDPDYWLAGYYEGLNRIYAGEHSKDFLGENDVSIGMLRKGSLDARKSVLLLADRYQFVKKCLYYYFLHEEGGLFGKMIGLSHKLSDFPEVKDGIYGKLERILQETKGMKNSLDKKIRERLLQCEKELGNLAVKQEGQKLSSNNKETEKIYQELSGSLQTILDFSTIVEDKKRKFREKIENFILLSDKNSMEDSAVEIRRGIANEYYDLYVDIVLRVLKGENLSMPVKMFLYFGYVDETLAGRENLVSLYEKAKELWERSSQNGVYPFIDWLKAIYEGKKEPSRNEFEVDYADYIRELKATKKITKEEAKAMAEDRMGKVRYELEHLFKIANKITFGRIATFCPVFCGDNLFKEVDSCFVREEMIEEKLSEIKKIDYTVFYRETLDLQGGEDMAREYIHVEKIPDFILMPNTGVRGAMWQEIEGRVRTTPGRMLLSIFHMEDLSNTMLRLTAEFRWELCKRMQGGRWNDVTEPSLTSLYCDYVQFYRKNSSLSPENKEKIKLSLQRAKNSFKEMFVRDYAAYIMYEGKGSPNLNKVARQILFAYCPFNHELMAMLEKNPLYTEVINLNRIKREQRLYRLEGLERKILKKTGKVPETLKREIEFVRGKK